MPAPTIAAVHVRKGAAIAQPAGSAAPAVGRPGDLLILDLTEPVEIMCPDGFETLTMQVSLEDLGLSPDAVRSAAHAYPSPGTTAGLLARHLARMASLAGVDTVDAAGQVLGETAVDLLRSLVAEAAGAVDEREISDQTLATRVRQYILAHLGETTLSPERIAREHFISTRKLYYLWSDPDENLSEWIIQRRLEAARLALASDVNGRISDVARTHGFVNTPHFNRRYRHRFGESPRDTQNQG